MLQPRLETVLRLTEGARLLYFSLRAEASAEGLVPNRIDLVRQLSLGDFHKRELQVLMSELWRAGLITFPASETVGEKAWIEVVDYRADDPRPDWAPDAKSGPPARKPALMRADRQADKPGDLKGV